MKTFNELSQIIETINSLNGICDEEKLMLADLFVEKFKENTTLENEVLDLKQKLKSARREVWS